MLGAFRVTLDGVDTTAFESDKVRALLAYLVVEADRPHRREKLAGIFWPDRPERNARRNLSQALFNLRSVIGDNRVEPPFLIITHHTLQFNRSSDHWSDVATLESLLKANGHHQHRRLASCDPCHERLRRAISLYSGDFLEGFSLPDSPGFEEWSLLEGERLHRLALEALHHLTQGQQTPRQAREALQYARRQVELDPWQEQGHRQLMRLLAISGQRGAALAQYQICRRILREELGVEPEAATTELYRSIRNETWTDPRTAAPVHNLPAAVTPFIGRKAELKAMATYVGEPDCRLLTLLGPGGIGKTRLALEFASSQLDNFGDGVFFVPLAPLQRASAIPSTVATALDFDFHKDDDPRQQLYDYMRHKRILLILDNFEHLLDGAELVVTILEAAPQVKIVVTSRARLNLRAEQILSVTGLGLSADEEAATHSDSVSLFVSTAQRVRPGYEPTRDDLLAILQI
jgi:DNA-binding SARP family transcriptional activator